MVTVIDYNFGNVMSSINMMRRLGVNAKLSNQKKDILKSNYLILPGNGSFDSCMENLEKSDLIPIIERKVFQENTPLLGICVGAQILGNSSEEGKKNGLGWLNMKVKKFKENKKIKIPHMGWNYIEKNNSNKNFFQFSKINNLYKFYFMHSYYMQAENEKDILFYTEYGHKFASALANKNIVAVQFHPEKSHKFGKMFFSDFLRLET